MFGAWYGEEGSGGWTPTSCGLVLNFEPGDQFYLTTVIGGTEYFVCDYQGYEKGTFNYKKGDVLKLIPADSDTEAPAGSVWTVGAPLERKFGGIEYKLGGIIYTMWSDEGRTLIMDSTAKNENYVFNGKIAKADRNPNKATDPGHSLADVVFAVPTIRSTCADPQNTLGRAAKKGDPFDGSSGEGWNGQVYREVYWFHKARKNGEYTYHNTALTAVNTTNGVIWQINAKDQGSGTRNRTLFRIYPINKPLTTCPSSFYFAWDVQNYLRYRKTNNIPGTSADSTSWRKIYTLDHLYCMDQVGSTSVYKTDGMQIPPSDSTYFYVGRNNKYHEADPMVAGKSNTISLFKSIRQLRVNALKDAVGNDTLFTPKPGAYGKMVIDTTVNSNNLDVTFEPAGYFLRTNSGFNIRLVPNADGTYWQTEQAWLISAIDASLKIKATLFTGPEFSASDPGADIRGWSSEVLGSSVPVIGGGSIVGVTGWARIYPGNSATNGGMVFVPVDANTYIHYDYNGHFGDEIPNQHVPATGERTLKIQDARLIKGYDFTGWNTRADGTGTNYAVGSTVDMDTIPEVDGKRVLHLYAQASYTGEINVAISFLKEDGKRYFMVYPGGAPRYSHARHFDDWTHIRLGIGDAANSNPYYLSTYKIIGKPTCIECEQYEYVLDPARHTMRGNTDSLTFYEDYVPEANEYLGLYYDYPYTVIANNSWAGLFQSSEGWPTPAKPCIDSTRIASSHYLTDLANGIGNFTRSQRPRDPLYAADTVMYYNAAGNYFGDTIAAKGTDFMISGVGVIDAHYVILPDTTDPYTPWVDEVTFDYHENTVEQRVWSELIGKQMLAQMTIGKEIVYFHPNPAKIFNTASQLSLSTDYRLEQTFTFIPDARHGSLDTLSEAFRPTMSATTNDFCRLVTSGVASPMEIKDDEGNYIDICDTIRVRLIPRATSKIKDYYGRWKTGSPGLVVARDGSRYRDIIVRTKTYHYGEKDSALVLTPAQEQYILNPLAGQKQRLTFKLQKQVFDWLHELRGGEHIRVGKHIISTTDVTSGNLALTTGSGSFSPKNPSDYFEITAAAYDSIVIATRDENITSSERLDTLIVSVSAKTIESKTYPAFTTRIPLMQAKMEGEELIWSVKYDGKRYYITAGSGGLIFRQYNQVGSTLYKESSTTERLVKGSLDAANSDKKYITPWKFLYTNQAQQQLRLKTEYGVFRGFCMSGESAPYTGALGDTTQAASASLTYEYVQINLNDNANFEEVVRLKYGSDNWLKFDGTNLVTTTNKAEASIFYWGYLQTEYSLLNNGTYPNPASLEFNYNRLNKTVQTRYKAYREYSMLVDSALVYLGRIDRDNMDTLTNAAKEWKTAYTVTFKRDKRFAEGASGLSIASTNATNLITTIAAASSVPMDKMIDGKYVDIVDTLDFAISLQDGAPDYQFKDKWSKFKSIEDAHLKIPLICKTYHDKTYDTLVCVVGGDQHNYTFPATINLATGDSVTFTLSTERHQGTQTMDIDDHVVATTDDAEEDIEDVWLPGETSGWNLSRKELTEIRLVDDYGNTPTWCHVSTVTANTITVKCTANGIRAPRTATLRIAYAVLISGNMHFANVDLTVSQPSYFQYANNQVLIHSRGASGDSLKNGMQQVHENKRILYYYNPSSTPGPDQNVELPVRERGFYGWWRWYEEGEGINEADIPAATWQTPPRNVGRFDYPYRIIGDSVFTVVDGDTTERKLVTMGRYTVFHYPSVGYSATVNKGTPAEITYNAKNDPPAKSPLVYPPTDGSIKTYVADISNYYDNLPLSTKSNQKNQVDTAKLDTMQRIIEPTLSLREVFELHPWTEMADTMDHYKSAVTGNKAVLLDNGAYPLAGEKYMEDHVMMAPIGNRLLLRTEQRYDYNNVHAGKHSESLLGYYMHDDNWSTWVGDKDTLIWCGGWDADCEWYTYNPKDGKYTACTHSVTTNDDFLDVPARAGISAGQEFDTVYYCLRSRSVKTTIAGDPAVETVNKNGDYWYNICRYMVIYHAKDKYGPLEETSISGGKKALITNDEIEQTYEVLERLDFDYNKPGRDYTVYPHPLPWADASYGYSYPVSPEIPDNRYHNDFAPNFPGPGEYGIINRIANSKFWRLMEQHGGAENGYMIYCDGMSSAGQVAALNLKTVLCEGQKMYFSAYVGNVSNQTGKANPNFHITVQGSSDGTDWKDITSYTTGDIQPSNNWYQIYFPINFNIKEGDASNLTHFRVRIYNMASTYDGNDFVLDDMCLFATKPPLIAYQANSTCVEKGENDSVTHVVIRVDYQGFNDDDYKGAEIYYAVDRIKVDKVRGNDTTFIVPIDGYINQDATHVHIAPATVDTVFGKVKMPDPTYVPEHSDSVFNNFHELSEKFEETFAGHERHPGDTAVFQQGYIYENIDNTVRPVLYIIHKAKMTPDCQYVVRMSLSYKDLSSSICAMTSGLKVSNRMVLELNGEERDNMENSDLCANTTYDLSLRVKGMQFADNASPLEVNGTCMSDWLPGDTTNAACLATYGYRYDVIVDVLKNILRCEPKLTTNPNQFAANLAAVNHAKMLNVQTSEKVAINGTYEPTEGSADDPYVILTNLVNRGLIMYQSKLTVHVAGGDSVQFTILPIVGSGSEDIKDANVEICPEPIYCKLKPKASQATPLIIGGSMRNPLHTNMPVVIVADSATVAASGVSVLIDYISPMRKWHSITLLSTDDPAYHEGVHTLNMVAAKASYTSGESMAITPDAGNNYAMRSGFSYTFGIVMQTLGGYLDDEDCPVGTIPFTISVVPQYLRWDPQTETADKWNDPDNWIGVTQQNMPIQENARFAPQRNTLVIIPTLTDGRRYPELADPAAVGFTDSIRQVGFQYNQCSAIRFMPGATIGEQQLLTYDSAIVDMTTPHGKWALRATPVKGMLTGDVFMSEADLNWRTSPWEVGAFDAAGRNHSTGNASFWLSFYNRAITQIGNNDQVKDSVRAAAAEWSRVINGMTDSLPAGMGWAVYTKTSSESDATVRLPKKDDVFYYYTVDGERADESLAHHDLRAMRTANAGGSGAGKLAYNASAFSYTLTNGVASNLFVFGNPTMAYIDIWGFISDNGLKHEFDYINSAGLYVQNVEAASGDNVLSNPLRYLPPMHAIVIKLADDATATSKGITLNASRVVTAPVSPASSAPSRNASGRRKGIMTVTAVNPADKICTSRLLLGQGYSDAIRDGEDAVITTINVAKFTSSAPSTPFNIYAAKDGYGLSINLLDEVVNVPLAFYNSNLPFEPTSYLWFTGVNNIDGQLVLYDALTGSERPIMDGGCLEIETPEFSHQTRYYIRRSGWAPEEPTNPITTEIGYDDPVEDLVVKFIHNGQVLVLRNGHVYTMFGQKLR